MSTITTTQKVLSITTLVLIGSIGAYYQLITTIHSLHGKQDTLRASVYERAQQTEEMQHTAQLVRETERERAELSQYLLNLNNPTPFLSLVESLGDSSGVRLEVESLTEVASPPTASNKKKTSTEATAPQGVPMVQVVITIEGRFDRVYHFLTLLEHMPYATTLTHTSLSQTPESDLWSGTAYLEIGTQPRN
jgi:hypothetical protein